MDRLAGKLHLPPGLTTSLFSHLVSHKKCLLVLLTTRSNQNGNELILYPAREGYTVQCSCACVVYLVQAVIAPTLPLHETNNTTTKNFPDTYIHLYDVFLRVVDYSTLDRRMSSLRTVGYIYTPLLLSSLKVEDTRNDGDETRKIQLFIS